MTFGETIKTIMTFSGIKSNQLAAAIGYDTSYISRWLSGEKLPTYRKENDIFKKIALFAVSVCDESELLNMALALNIQSLPKTKEEIADTLSNVLEENYFRQKDYENRKKYSPQTVVDSLVVTDTTAERFGSLISECVYNAFNSENMDSLEIMTTVKIGYTPRIGRDMISVLRELADKDHPIHVQHIVGLDQIRNNVNDSCRGLFHALRSCEGLNYEVFVSDDSEMCQTQLTVLKDSVYLRRITDAFAPHPYFLMSKDNWLISNAVLVFREATRNFRPAMERTSDLHFTKNRHLIDYMMQDEFEDVMNIMHPLYMERDFFMETYNKYWNNGEEWEMSFGLRMSQTVNKKVILFKGAFLDYLYYGKIVLQGEVQYFEPEDRIKHLRQIADAIREYADFKIAILEDNNPLLCFNELDCSVYLTDRNAHATCYNLKQDSFIVNDVSVINAFREFVNALFELPDSYCIKGQKAVELIENAISWLEMKGQMK